MVGTTIRAISPTSNRGSRSRGGRRSSMGASLRGVRATPRLSPRRPGDANEIPTAPRRQVGHRLDEPLLGGVWRLVAEEATGLLDRVVQVEPEELVPRLVH